jgi:hypothetical protein
MGRPYHLLYVPDITRAYLIRKADCVVAEAKFSDSMIISSRPGKGC